MKHEDEPMDLLSEARRRPLSREEEARLEELVERSPEARILHYAGWSFDRDSSAREGDDVLVARLAARAAERGVVKVPAPLPLRRRRRPFVTLLAAALAVAGTAGAGAGVVYLVRAPERAPSVASPAANVAPAVAAEAKSRRPGSTVASPVAAAEPSVVPVPEPVPAPELAPVPAPVPKAPSVSAAKPKPAVAERSAAALFGEANQKRLDGDTPAAVALYKLLTERYPGSAEANLAELSLGKLLLASGNAEGALGYFRRAAASGGALGSEASWGEASALRALGRTSEERAALERLLALYPDGAYAKAARKRLGADAR